MASDLHFHLIEKRDMVLSLLDYLRACQMLCCIIYMYPNYTNSPLFTYINICYKTLSPKDSAHSHERDAIVEGAAYPTPWTLRRHRDCGAGWRRGVE